MSDFDNYDDLDAVRDFRSLSVPFPGAVDAAVRRRIFELAAERGIGRGIHPLAPPVPLPPSDAVPRPGSGPRPTAVVELATAGPARTRRYHRCMVAVSVGLAVTLTVGVVVRRTLARDTISVGAPPASEAVVRPAGAFDLTGWRDLVARQADRPLPAGMYAYQKVERGLPGAVSVNGGPVVQTLVRQVEQRWAADSRPGRLLVAADRPSADAGGVGARELPAADEELRPAVAFAGRSYADVRALPADPVALASLLATPAQTPAGDWDGLLPAVFDGLSEQVVRPEVRAALVTVLAGRGLAPAGDVTDRAGRPGVGFRLEDGPWSWTVVVDGATGRVRGWEVRRTGSAAADAYLVVLESEIVPHVART